METLLLMSGPVQVMEIPSPYITGGRLPRKRPLLPCVQAYKGHLPTGWRGIEFTTPIAPVPSHCTPWEARWYANYCAGVNVNAQGFAVIPVSTFRNMQP